MNTKTLLVAAATLAAGAFASQAQVYSQNVVGYYNVTVPANNGLAFVANQLLNSDGTNGVNDVLANGLVSDPNGVTNTVLYYWNGAGYTPFFYYDAADSGSSAGWYDENGNLATITFPQGSGAFLQNPFSSTITVTVVGSVLQTTNAVAIPRGINPYSIEVPISTNIDASIVNFPATSPGDQSGNVYDTYYHWNGSGFTPLFYYNAVDAGGAAGWYDENGTDQDGNPAFWPTVGQAFFIDHEGPTPYVWTNSFTVQ